MFKPSAAPAIARVMIMGRAGIDVKATITLADTMDTKQNPANAPVSAWLLKRVFWAYKRMIGQYMVTQNAARPITPAANAKYK